jgi:hypothetical protein
MPYAPAGDNHKHLSDRFVEIVLGMYREFWRFVDLVLYNFFLSYGIPSIFVFVFVFTFSFAKWMNRAKQSGGTAVRSKRGLSKMYFLSKNGYARMERPGRAKT